MDILSYVTLRRAEMMLTNLSLADISQTLLTSIVLEEFMSMSENEKTSSASRYFNKSDININSELASIISTIRQRESELLEAMEKLTSALKNNHSRSNIELDKDKDGELKSAAFDIKDTFNGKDISAISVDYNPVIPPDLSTSTESTMVVREEDKNISLETLDEIFDNMEYFNNINLNPQEKESVESLPGIPQSLESITGTGTTSTGDPGIQLPAENSQETSPGGNDQGFRLVAHASNKRAYIPTNASSQSSHARCTIAEGDHTNMLPRKQRPINVNAISTAPKSEEISYAHISRQQQQQQQHSKDLHSSETDSDDESEIEIKI